MVTIRYLIVVSAFLILISSMLTGQGSQAATKENLDLPFDAIGISEDVEDAPEVIFFYTQQFEGAGFFFCLDRSSSTAQGELLTEIKEAIRTISQFSNKVQFTIVFYDQGVLKWPSSGKPAEANAGTRSAAICVRRWLKKLEVKTLFIEPGSPWENGYVESFNGKLRDELLEREIFDTFFEAKVLVERWRREYNTFRPHSSPGYLPPAPEAIEPKNMSSGASPLRSCF